MIERYNLPEMKALWGEENKYRKWLDVELAAVRAWAELGRIPQDAADEIIKKADFDIPGIRKYEEEVEHVVIAFLSNVADNIGTSSRYVHLGLTSSDMWDTATALLLVEAAGFIIARLDETIEAAATLAAKYKYTPVAGRTHGMHAEPTTFGLKMALYYADLKRAKARLERARDEIGFGKISGAVGTYAQLSPEMEELTLKHLGLKTAPISNQIIQRDRHAEYVSAMAICGAVLEKIALEVRHLQRTEVAEAAEPFASGQKGSSSMPHKKNPVLCERICGLARVLRGFATVSLENVALWHERDISHSSAERYVFPDCTATLFYMLTKMGDVLSGLVVNEEKMLADMDLTGGGIYSGRVLVALAEAGMSREDAYKIVQEGAMSVYRGEAVHLREVLLWNDTAVDLLGEDGIRDLFSVDYYTRYVDDIFKRIGL
ncbi:MAG: adenylosuccinate lyase [bacterium]|nr:adenylosuccinate lyase [bacterium]